ncbi:hypothetical protein ES288_A09G123700v1, partial [Gossypium darwinii]
SLGYQNSKNRRRPSTPPFGSDVGDGKVFSDARPRDPGRVRGWWLVPRVVVAHVAEEAAAESLQLGFLLLKIFSWLGCLRL